MTVIESISEGPALVSGVAGFIEKRVVATLLEQGHRVVAVQHKAPLPDKLRLDVNSCLQETSWNRDSSVKSFVMWFSNSPSISVKEDHAALRQRKSE